MPTLTLNAAAPSPDPLAISSGSAITITNAMNVATTVSGFPPGTFNPAPGNSIALPAGGNWTGTVGNTKGSITYEYTVPSPAKGTRSGTININ